MALPMPSLGLNSSSSAAAENGDAYIGAVTFGALGGVDALKIAGLLLLGAVLWRLVKR